MSVIYLSHPVHGMKVATMDLEARQDESRGWTRVPPPSAAPPDDPPLAVETENALRRRGRPRVNKDD
jgi:hypothetical protein